MRVGGTYSEKLNKRAPWLFSTIVHPQVNSARMEIKGDDITDYINLKQSCQEYSPFQIERLGITFPLDQSERPPGLSTNEMEAVSQRLSKAEFQPAQAQATQAGLSTVNWSVKILGNSVWRLCNWYYHFPLVAQMLSSGDL